VEIYALRVDGVVSTDKPKLALLGDVTSGPGQPEAGVPKASRELAAGTGVQRVDVHEWRDLRPGQSVPGPAVIESQLTTVMVPAGWRADIDELQNVALRAATK
jgi:N-methylhydantoinase A/oxoprolinase/acetone carboxylase beta subunit